MLLFNTPTCGEVKPHGLRKLPMLVVRKSLHEDVGDHVFGGDVTYDCFTLRNEVIL